MVSSRRMEEISWTDCVRNEEELRKVNERNILREVKRRKTTWIGHMLRRKGLVKHVLKER
jgi:hypothetical protein